MILEIISTSLSPDEVCNALDLCDVSVLMIIQGELQKLSQVWRTLQEYTHSTTQLL